MPKCCTACCTYVQDPLSTDTCTLLGRQEEYILMFESMIMWHAYKHRVNEDMQRSALQGRQELRHYLRT